MAIGQGSITRAGRYRSAMSRPSRNSLHVSLAAPSVSGQARLVHEGLNWATTVNGTTHDHFEIRQWRLAAGRYFTEEEERSAGQVVVLGSLVARKAVRGG